MTSRALESTAAKPRLMPQLDSLRCVAAVAVVLHHTLAHRIPWLGRVGIGVYGVWFFFVLSGFLITGILLRETGPNAPRIRDTLRVFYARRFLRIFPAYYLVLAVGIAFGIGTSFRADWPWHVAYLSNWMMAARGHWADAASPTWSLGVEEQFYLVWPAIVLFAPRRRLPLVFTLAVCVGIASRLFVVVTGIVHQSDATLVTPTPSNLDPLAIGALLAWGHDREAWSAMTWKLTRWGLWAGLAILGFVALTSAHLTDRGWTFVSVFETTGAALVSVWVIDRAARGVSPRRLAGRMLDAPVLRYLGSISYGIYLWHNLVIAVVFAHLPASARPFIATTLGGLLVFAAVLLVTVGIASLSWALYEKPINDLKRYVPYPRRASAIPAAVTAAAV